MNSLRIHTFINLFVAFVVGIFAVGLFTPTATAADCPLTFEEPADVFNYAQDGTLEFSQFQKQDGQAAITVTNNSDCELSLALGSYEMMTGNQLSEQQLHDQHQQAVPAQSSRTLKVDLPSCMSQIDLYHDPNEDGVPTPPQPANAKLIGFTFSGNEKDIFAENDIFHFDEESPYNNLDDFPNDDDDGYRNATPSDDSRYCDVPPATCPFPDDQLPVEEPADVFNYVQDGTLEFSEFQKNNGQAAISITNNSNCEFPVSLGIYEMFDNTFENQELFSKDTTVVGGNSQVTVSAELPACMAQIDLLYDPNQDGPPETPSSANPNLIGFTFNQNENDIFAENDIFHFSDGHPYENLDNFPNDDDDSPRNAGPAANFCPAESPTTKLTIIKEVTNKQGRSVTADDFSITATPQSGSSPSLQFPGSDEGTTRDVSGVEYYLSESGPDNVDYTSTYSGDCSARSGSAGGTVTPQPGETAVCTITNRLANKPAPEPVSCPFTEGQNGGYDRVITFSDNELRSDQQRKEAVTEIKNLDLDSGSYTIGMFAYTQYSGRTTQVQSNEQFFVQFANSGNNYIAETISTNDLEDGVTTATTTQITDITLDQPTDSIQARHSAFFGKVNDDGTPNSHNVGCVAVDRQHEPDPLTGTCSVNPDNPETGQTVTWSSSASGGSGNYTFNWSGDANGDTSTVNETYQTSGQKTASITIGDGNNTITRTCRVNVSDDDDGNGDDPTRLTIIKQVANRDGRDVTSSDFTITATPHTGNSSSYSFPGSSSGVTRDVASIRYNLSETGPEDIDYNTTYSGDCMARDDGGGQVTPESEQTTTCTITNTLEDDNDNGGGNGGGSGGGGAVLDPRDDDDDDDDGQVRGEQDPEFSVQCEPENDTYLIGQQVTFNAEVSGDADNEDVTFDWENGNDLDASNDQATAQYLSAGTKSVTVTAQYDDVTESDVCSVDIRAAANQSGVRLDQLPYTGPGSTAQTLAFGLLILLIATSGSYLALRRFRSDGIPVGIPQDGKQE